MELFILADDPFYSVAEAGQWVDKIWIWSNHDMGELMNANGRWIWDELQDLIIDIAIVKEKLMQLSGYRRNTRFFMSNWVMMP